MTLWTWMDSRARGLGIVDTKLAQGASMFLALVIVKLVPEILTLSAWWFAGLCAACAVRPAIVFFGRRPTPMQPREKA